MERISGRIFEQIGVIDVPKISSQGSVEAVKNVAHEQISERMCEQTEVIEVPSVDEVATRDPLAEVRGRQGVSRETLETGWLHRLGTGPGVSQGLACFICVRRFLRVSHYLHLQVIFRGIHGAPHSFSSLAWCPNGQSAAEVWAWSALKPCSRSGRIVLPGFPDLCWSWSCCSSCCSDTFPFLVGHAAIPSGPGQLVDHDEIPVLVHVPAVLVLFQFFGTHAERSTVLADEGILAERKFLSRRPAQGAALKKILSLEFVFRREVSYVDRQQLLGMSGPRLPSPQADPLIVPVRALVGEVTALKQGDVYIRRGSKRPVQTYQPHSAIVVWSSTDGKFWKENPQHRWRIQELSGLRHLCHCGAGQGRHADNITEMFRLIRPQAFDRADEARVPTTAELNVLARARSERQDSDNSEVEPAVLAAPQRAERTRKAGDTRFGLCGTNAVAPPGTLVTRILENRGEEVSDCRNVEEDFP